MPANFWDGTLVTPRLVLASGSPRRADVLRQLGLEPAVRPADVDEAYLPGEMPAEHVDRLARAKAATAITSVSNPRGQLRLSVFEA